MYSTSMAQNKNSNETHTLMVLKSLSVELRFASTIFDRVEKCLFVFLGFLTFFDCEWKIHLMFPLSFEY